MLFVVYFLFNLDEIDFVFVTGFFVKLLSEDICLRNTLCSEILWDTLKAQISKKNGISKSIVIVIKHAIFSCIGYTLTELFKKPDN